jgi:hypothetical protein
LRQSFLPLLEMVLNWYWTFARSNAIVDIQCKLAEVPIGVANLPVWSSSNGIYYCAVTWELLREK